MKAQFREYKETLQQDMKSNLHDIRKDALMKMVPATHARARARAHTHTHTHTHRAPQCVCLCARARVHTCACVRARRLRAGARRWS